MRVESLKEEIEDILWDNPGRKNPVDKTGTYYVYDDSQGNRCLIGEWIYQRTRLDFIDLKPGGIYGIWKDRETIQSQPLRDLLDSLTYDEVVFLREIQIRADTLKFWDAVLGIIDYIPTDPTMGFID